MAAQTGIFNVLDNGLSPSASAGTNTTALQNLVTSLLSSGGPTQGNGGTILFPMIDTGTYLFNGTITVGPNPATIIFQGSTAGSGTTGASPSPTPVLQQTVNSDLFLVSNNPGGSANIGGIVFEDLQIAFSAGLTSGAAVHVNDSENVRLNRVVLVNCPQGLWLEHSEQCSMLQCTIFNASNSGTGLMLGGPNTLNAAIETYVDGCRFLGFHLATGTAVQIYGCEHLRMSNTRVEGFGQSVVITPDSNTGSARKIYLSNVSCFPNSNSAATGAGLLIQVSGGKYVTEAWFAQCEFTPPQAGTSYTGGGIVIDPGSDEGDVLDQIRFVDCYSCLWPGPGIQINGGTNIEILGGYYSCNNQGESPAHPYSPSGIVVAGAASGVRIVGAACNNLVNAYGTQQPQTQKYGIYIRNGAQSVRINACDLTGNLTNSLVVDGSAAAPSDVFVGHTDCTGVSPAVDVILPVGSLEIFHCPGYNDQRPVLNANNAPTLTAPLSASTCSTPYFGPSAVTFSDSAALSVFLAGTYFTMSFGDFYLSRPTDPVGFGAQPSAFAWIGK